MSDKPETLEGIWKDDLLERRKDAERIIRFVTAEVRERKATEQVASYVLNVDSAWGQGKTFFLKRLQDHLQFEGHKVALINAWEDDHGEDPLIPFVIELDKLIGDGQPIKKAAKIVGFRLGKLGSKIVPLLFAGYLKQKIGDAAFEGIMKEVAKEAIDGGGKALSNTVEEVFASFEEKKNSSVNFKKQLKELAEKEDKPVFVLIDELDRCRPTYAILLLERIKHFFEADNVVFIVATDTEQLGHSIKAVYGNDFDSRAYLRRFFMRTYTFPEPPLHKFIEDFFSRKSEDFRKKLSSPPNNDHADFIAAWAEAAALSIRDLQQCLDLLATLRLAWEHPFEIELALAMPLIIAHHWREHEIVANLSNLSLSEQSITSSFIKTKKPRAITLNFSPDLENKLVANVEAVLTGFLREANRSPRENVNFNSLNYMQRWIRCRNLQAIEQAEAIRSYGAKIEGASCFRGKQ